MQNELLTLSITADPQTQKTCGATIPSDGVLQQIRILFPNSKNVVQARVYINGHQLVPSRGDVLIDNGPVDIPVGQSVREGDHIMLWVGNPDQSPHTINASFLLENAPQNPAYGMSGAIVQPIQIPEEAQRQGNQGGNNVPTPSNPPTPDQGQGTDGGPGSGPGDQGPGQSLGGIPSNALVAPGVPGNPATVPGSVSPIPKLTPQAPMRPNVHNVPTYPSVYGGIYPQDVGGTVPPGSGVPNSIHVDATLAMLFVFGLLLIFILLVVLLKEKKL